MSLSWLKFGQNLKTSGSCVFGPFTCLNNGTLGPVSSYTPGALLGAQLRFAGDPGDTTALHPHSESEASPRSYMMFSANTAESSAPKPLAFGAGGDEQEGSQPWAH